MTAIGYRPAYVQKDARKGRERRLRQAAQLSVYAATGRSRAVHNGTIGAGRPGRARRPRFSLADTSRRIYAIMDEMNSIFLACRLRRWHAVAAMPQLFYVYHQPSRIYWRQRRDISSKVR